MSSLVRTIQKKLLAKRGVQRPTVVDKAGKVHNLPWPRFAPKVETVGE